ncbi:MAG: DUF4974 domain-containing protein [Chitinophagaceae bacterium]|nr:DUF4974 domain-containing protein [Chitinophagaceae bacterium]MCW5928880.1 DUF4974 domain-containing protein [Chitinophagaceae bacterium]
MSSNRIWVLMAKKDNGEASVSELEELEELLRTGDMHPAVVETLLASPLHSLPECKVPDAVWNRIETTIEEEEVPQAPTPRIHRFSTLWRVAAILVLVTGAVLFYITRHPSAEQESPEQIVTQAADIRYMQLPDGSTVKMNGKSRLSFTQQGFGKTTREVVLEGEAFFDVVKNETIPFIIHTSSVAIRVKGTSFNVKAYPDQNTVEAALVSGIIELSTKQDPERKILLKPNEKIIIRKDGFPAIPVPDTASRKPGIQPIEYTISELKTHSNLLSDTAWMCNRLEFDNEKLGDVATRLEGWFNVAIHFRDEKLKDKRFSGILEKETLEQTLRALQLSYRFDYEIQGDQLIIGK